MSLTLQIPVRQQITLPDDWQECLTPQELSYWLIAKFEGFENAVENVNSQFTDIDTRINRLIADHSTYDRDLNRLSNQIQTVQSQATATADAVDSLDSQVSTISQAQTAMGAEVEQNTQDVSVLKNQIKLVPLFQHDLSFSFPTFAGTDTEFTLRIFSQSSTPITSFSNDLRQHFGDRSSIPLHGLYRDPNAVWHTIATAEYVYTAPGGRFVITDNSGTSISFTPSEANITRDSVIALMPNLPAM